MNSSEQDPWTWGNEDNVVEEPQHNEWSNVWSISATVSSDFKKTKEKTNPVKHPPNQGHDYFDTISLRSTPQQQQQNWSHTGDSAPANFAYYLPQSTTAHYFNNNNNNSGNNNSQNDVENKEVAPPDNKYNRNARQSSLLREAKPNRLTQEQKTGPTTQVNQSVNLSESSAPPLTTPLFGTKQYPGSIYPQDNTFQNLTYHPNSMLSSVANTSYPPTNHHYNNSSTSQPSQSPHCFSNPSVRSEAELENQMQPNSLIDVPSQKPVDLIDAFGGPYSLPSFHSLQSSVVSSNSLEYGGHHSTQDSSDTIADNTDENSKGRPDVAHSHLPPNDSAALSFRQQARQHERTISQPAQQDKTDSEKSSSSSNPLVTEYTSISNKNNYPPQFSQSVIHEETSLETPLVPKLELRMNKLPSEHQGAQQVPIHHQEFNQPSNPAQPSFSHQIQDSQQPAVSHHPTISHQLPVSHQTTYSYPSSVTYTAAVPLQPPSIHLPLFSQPPPNSHQTVVSYQPSIPQQVTASQQSLVNHQFPQQVPPPVSHQSQNTNQYSISNHHPVVSQPAINDQPPISHLPPVSQHPPVTHHPMSTSQPQLPHQPVLTNQPPATYQFQTNQPFPVSYQPSVTNQIPVSIQENVDTMKISSNISQKVLQDVILSDSEAVEPKLSQKLNSNVSSELYYAPLEVHKYNQSGLSSLNMNPPSKEIETEKTSTRYSPNPQQLPPSKSPPNIPSIPNPQVPQNINSVDLSHVVDESIDNGVQNCSNINSRNQISFNLQNVHPMASSSPLSVQNIPENQERIPENHELPDNSENLLLEMKNLSLNRERESESQIHCQVDRNQYLETGHLSGSKDHILTDNSTNVEAVDESEAPPPGLHRLVTGQGCETRGSTIVGDHPLLMVGADSSTVPESNRQSSPSTSTAGSVSDNRNAQSGPVGESETHARTARLVQGQSIGDDTDGVREVPGEATPFHNRIVLGQMGRGVTPPLLQDSNASRGDNSRDREIVGRMVLGERYDRDLSQNVSTQDEFRQSHRSLRRSRRAESSYEDEEHDYPSDRDRRVDEYKRRGDDRDRIRHRPRREHRSPEYRSDEEFEDRRGFTRIGRNERRPREFSPEIGYYGNYRDEHRRHRRYDHYRDYEDDYYYRENRSRPSSRTGSDYRRTNMDYMCGRVNARHMFYPELGAIPYNPRAPEEYYEAMRRLDPMGYAAWYNQYMSSRYNVQQTQANYNNDRASVHSGQSSTNNRPNVETPQAGVEDLAREEDFVNATAHVKGKLDSYGRLLVIDPHYPTENQKPTVNFYKISKLPSDPDVEEFLESPGPFVPGVTHRNTVLQYLKWISEKSTKSSEKLLYDLIHLSVKSNGELNGLDVADLLMESYRKSQNDEGSVVSEKIPEQISAKETLTKFRELLQQGNKTEALEWAIDHDAWGHALFLASKMDDRTHNNIMLRFANSIPHTDPLQTLYQLMSGHVPQASTCCADKKWSDWRPHLAMILGNPTGNPKLDRKAIIKLGDSLFARGRIFASHFCYITAQADFTSYQSDAKFVLLGSNPNQEFTKFATCKAIIVTMCYEYGLKLRQANTNIPSLQLYKFILANRLIDYGKSRIALQYCELIANEAVRNDCCERSLIASVIELSSKLKMLDPTLSLTGDTESDPDWLTKLKHFYNNLSDDYDAGLMMSHGVSSSTVSEVGQEIIPPQDKIDSNDMVNMYNNEATANCNKIEFSMPSIPTIQTVAQPMQPLTVQTSLPSEIIPEEEPPHQTFQPNSLPPLSSNSYPAEPFPQQNAMDPYWNSSNIINTANSYSRQETVETTAVSNSKNNFFKASEEQLKLNEISKESNRSNKKTTDNKTANKLEESQHNSGWFGGIWEKLSIRPKNQMRLPDDSNPSIVWDEQKKKWVNLDGDDDGPSSVKPPPRMVEATRTQPLPSDNLVKAPPPSSGNKYKIQKGKMMKSNYVNVMGTTNKNQQNTPRPMDGLLPVPLQPNNTNFFVPPSAEAKEYQPVDFINTGAPALNSKPAEGHLENKQDFPQGITAPTMYNPARYPVGNDC